MMRSMSNAVKSAVEAHVVRPFGLMEIFLDSETLRMTSLDRNIKWNNNTYVGVGDFGKITQVEESMEFKVAGLTATLSGIPNEYIDSALTEKYRNRTVKVYIGVLDQNYQIIIDPIVIFEGPITGKSVDHGQVSVVHVHAKNELVRWETPKIRRHTNADQQNEFSGDLGVEFVNDVAEKEIIWGKSR